MNKRQPLCQIPNCSHFQRHSTRFKKKWFCKYPVSGLKVSPWKVKVLDVLSGLTQYPKLHFFWHFPWFPWSFQLIYFQTNSSFSALIIYNGSLSFWNALNLTVGTPFRRGRRGSYLRESLRTALFQINVLADHGGGDLKDTVIGILRHLFTNRLASSYNVEGINRNLASGGSKDKTTAKIGLRSTFMYDIVLGIRNLSKFSVRWVKCLGSHFSVLSAAVKKRIARMKARGTNITCDAKFYNAYMGGWLKDAPQRLKNEKKRQEKRTRACDDESDLEVWGLL